jgi:hypothetical protein
MSWSYSGNPSDSNLDAVRFLCGDVDTNNQQISNEEITFLLTAWNSNTYLAAAFASDGIAAKLSAKADLSRSVGDLSISTQYGSQAKVYMERAASLRVLSSRAYPPSVTFDTTTFDGSFDFSVGMDENMGSANTAPTAYGVSG